MSSWTVTYTTTVEPDVVVEWHGEQMFGERLAWLLVKGTPPPFWRGVIEATFPCRMGPDGVWVEEP